VRRFMIGNETRGRLDGPKSGAIMVNKGSPALDLLEPDRFLNPAATLMRRNRAGRLAVAGEGRAHEFRLRPVDFAPRAGRRREPRACDEAPFGLQHPQCFSEVHRVERARRSAFAASFVFVTVVTPRYTGEARLILESRDSFYTRPNQDRTEQPLQIDEQAVASQVQVVMSRDLAREAIKQLGLVGNEEFDPLAGEMGFLRRLMILIGVSKNPLDRPAEDRVLENYYERLLVYPVGKSRIVAIEFRSKDPELAAKGANTIAELYLNLQEGAKKDTARNASTWLGTNIETLRQRVAEAEAKVEEFRGKSGLFMGANNAPINAQHLSELNTQLAQARTAKADAEAKAKLIRDMIKNGRTFEIPDVANNELIRRLIEQRINLRAQLALELRTLLSEHPRIKELNAQVNDLEAQVRGAAERTVRTLENDAKIAGSRVETLQAAIDAQKGVVAQANEAEVQLRALEREAKAQRDQLESYLTRYREATARDAENAVPPDARIVSRAIVPDRPSFPKKLPIVFFSTLAGLVLACGCVVGRELLAGPGTASAAAPEYPEEDAFAAAAGEGDPGRFSFARQDPFAGGAPPAANAARALLAPPMSAEAERFELEALIARLSEVLPEGRGRRVLVTGLEPKSSAPDLAKALGRTLALQKRAILVSIDSADEPATRHGFTDLVAGEVSFAAIIGRENQSRLHVVGAGFLDGALLAEEWQAVDVAFSAFDQTYDWILCLLHNGLDPELLKLLAPRMDTVVVTSNEDCRSSSSTSAPRRRAPATSSLPATRNPWTPISRRLEPRRGASARLFALSAGALARRFHLRREGRAGRHVLRLLLLRLLRFAPVPQLTSGHDTPPFAEARACARPTASLLRLRWKDTTM
jgi:succinoglycan biosynthesis transport protein ExoP